jgi:uncharacterized repeat protein (TIGR03803 family)
MRKSAAAIAVALLWHTALANAASLNTVYSFTGKTDGAGPTSGLSLRGTVLYGTAATGGASSSGVVYSYDFASSSFTTLYSFTGKDDGATPGQKPIIGPGGYLFGVTRFGGAASTGTVWELNTTSGAFQLVYSFQGGADAANPEGGLVVDKNSNLDGTSFTGGSRDSGTVFQVNPTNFSEKVLASFNGKSGGKSPRLLTATSGGAALYGTTFNGGGASSSGTIFATDPVRGRTRTLYKFTGGNDGATPSGGLLYDGSGSLYGDAQGGGSSGYGTLYKFNIASKQLTPLYTFMDTNDGAKPSGGLIFDKSGNIYGVTSKYGTSSANGSLFRFNPSTKQFTTLVTFTHGENPGGFLTLDASGRIWGTTGTGGTNGLGSIYVYKP